MGALIGLIGGLGLFSIWWSCWADDAPAAKTSVALPGRVEALIAEAGVRHMTPGLLILVSVGAFGGAGLAALAASGSPVIAACFALLACLGPRSYLASRARRRRKALREVWPEVVDHLRSAVQAGLSLPEAISDLAITGPIQTRAAFAGFATEYRTTGRLEQCLDTLKTRLANASADRLIEALRLTHEVGGTDLGRLLRTLSEFVRDDARIRGELEARQSWTVNGARVAAAGPWLVLALLLTRPGAAAAFNSAAGALVLGVGAALTLLAFRLMVRIGRLPEESRVLA